MGEVLEPVTTCFNRSLRANGDPAGDHDDAGRARPLRTDAIGRPITFFMSAGQVSDYTGAAALLRSLPGADWLIADRGYCEGERH